MPGKALTRLAIAAVLTLGTYARNAMTSEKMQVVHPKFRGASNPMIAELKTKMQTLAPPSELAVSEHWKTIASESCAEGDLIYSCNREEPTCEMNSGFKSSCENCLYLMNDGSGWISVHKTTAPASWGAANHVVVAPPTDCAEWDGANDVQGKKCMVALQTGASFCDGA